MTIYDGPSAQRTEDDRRQREIDARNGHNKRRWLIKRMRKLSYSDIRTTIERIRHYQKLHRARQYVR